MKKIILILAMVILAGCGDRYKIETDVSVSNVSSKTYRVETVLKLNDIIISKTYNTGIELNKICEIKQKQHNNMIIEMEKSKNILKEYYQMRRSVPNCKPTQELEK